MINWNNDDELFDMIRKDLNPSVIGDIMDKMGLQHQFLPPQIHPLRHDMVIAGRAMTVLEADIESEGVQTRYMHLKEIPFGLMLRALDDLKKNEVYICTGSSNAYALWGELMSTRAIQLGAAGAVVHGYSRDTTGILSLNFPVFSSGRYAQDQEPRGKVVDFRTPIVMGGVKVNTGDLVVGNLDGVCIIPKESAEDILSLSLEKARGEKMVQQKIKEGLGATDAFALYGIM